MPIPLTALYGPPGPGSGTAVGTVSSTAAVALGAALQAVYVAWVPTTPGDGSTCHVRFGSSSVGEATTADHPLTEGKPLRIVPERTVTHVRAIAVTGGGVLHVAPAVIT